MKHIPRKRFGQNFLQDQAIINQIINCINPQPGQVMLEIGPGLAALTKPLLAKLGKLSVVELDRDIINFLEHNFSRQELTIYQGDALKFDFAPLGTPLRVVGNLPYNISTPLLFHLSQFANIQDMTFMLQKEVVERICADAGSRDYGKLSVMLQYKYRCRNLLAVPPESFYPAPKVDSAIVQLKPLPEREGTPIDEVRLNQVVSKAFSQRRKTLSNCFKGMFSAAELISFDIDPSARAEQIPVEKYVELSKLLHTGEII